jgi:hypothetical protein
LITGIKLKKIALNAAPAMAAEFIRKCRRLKIETTLYQADCSISATPFPNAFSGALWSLDGSMAQGWTVVQLVRASRAAPGAGLAQTTAPIAQYDGC